VEIVAFAGFALVLAAVLCGFAAAWWGTAYGRGLLEEAWSAYARRRGVEYQPASGEWPNRSVPVLRWTDDDGARFRIEARGREGKVRTYVVARPTVAVFGEVLVARPGALDATARSLNGRLVVRARPQDLEARMLTDDVKRALFGFDLGGFLSLSYARGDVVLGWEGGERNDARLDEALDVVRRVVRALGASHDRGDQKEREAV
jgi:hypothetical protein